MDLESIHRLIDLLKKTLLTEDLTIQVTKNTIASITRQLLRIPMIAGNPGLPEISQGVAYINCTVPIATTAINNATNSSATSASNTASTSATRSSSASVTNNGKVLNAFERGIAEILQIIPGKLPTVTEIPTIALELKSFKHAENRPFTDVLRVIIPLVFSTFTLPTDPKVNSKEFIQLLQSTINAWTGLFERLRTTVLMEDLNQEYAIIAATANFVCQNAGLKQYWIPRFGLLLNFLYDNDIISSDSIIMWHEDAQDISEGTSSSNLADDEDDDDDDGPGTGADIGISSADAKLLLVTPFFKKLLERIEEDEEDDEDEDDDEEDDE